MGLLRGARFRRAAPEFFQAVEFTGLGAEQMHHYVAGVDQDPVAMRQAFDGDFLEPVVLEFCLKMVGHDADVPLRRAAGDDQKIGDVGLSSQVYEDNILRFVVFESLDYQRLKRGRRR